MTIFFAILALAAVGFLVAVLIKNKKLEISLEAANQESERLRQYYEAEALRIYNEAQAAVSKAQKAVDQQLADFKEESERIRKHYEAEALKIKKVAYATLTELEPLRKYESLRDAEAEIKRILSDAMTGASALHSEAQTLLEQSRNAATEERSKATQRAKEIRSQAEVLLTQATRDAGRIVEEATKRAEEIAGDAYIALRDKQTLEQAVQALWNVTEGYGDRYVIPSRSVLDELATDFGNTEAGEALKNSREHSRRMVEQKQAATCKYEEADRRDRANRFVVDAFNGRVDAILSRTKHDNYGTLEQEIRDAFSLVNLNGLAFRDARILPAYLDARLAELKWAVVVHELRRKEREEQRRIQEQMREEEKVRREIERAMRESANEQEIIRRAMEKAQQQVREATEGQKAKYEQQLQELSQKLKEAEERNQRALSMAQQTKLGHVYIISNVGSFGENIFKIGMTRRLVPQDRIDELGDSSVPFDFDVHAMIRCDDAPALEAKLHKHFVMSQMNKVNHRREFFRVDLKHIREEIETLGITPQWTMTAEATEYRESLAIEEAIKKNPARRDAWVKRQFHLELLDQELEEAVKETVGEIQPVPLS